MEQGLYDRLCPRIFEHRELGKVSWNDRSRAFEAGRPIWGSKDYVPILIYGEQLLDGAAATLRRLEGRKREFAAPAAKVLAAIEPRDNSPLARPNPARFNCSRKVGPPGGVCETTPSG